MTRATGARPLDPIVDGFRRIQLREYGIVVVFGVPLIKMILNTF